MNEAGRERSLSNILVYLLAAISLAGILAYLITAILRVFYPFELEWMEGGMVVEMLRILHGKQLYTPPSIDYIPYIYTPLYLYFSAFVSKITVAGFLPLRLVSFAATILNIILIYAIVLYETKSIRAGIWGAGMFCFTFAIGGAWFEIARPDSLALLFVLISVYVLRRMANPIGFILAGITLSAAFWTKQSTLVAIFPLAIYIVITSRWKVVYFLIPPVVLIAGADLYFNYLSDGWLNYYIFRIPQETGIKWPVLALFWASDLIRPMPIAFSLLLYCLIVNYKKDSNDRFLFYLMVSVGLICSAIPGRIHPGGYVNVLIPAYAALSIFFAIGLNDIIFNSEIVAERKHLRAFIIILALCQFIMLKYNPADYIPTEADRIAGEKLISIIKSYEGDVLIPYHAYYGPIADKNPHFHEVALRALEAGDKETADRIKAELSDAIRSRKYDAIITDYLSLTDILDSNYTLSKTIFENPDVFYPSTGYKTRPEYIFVPDAMSE